MNKYIELTFGKKELDLLREVLEHFIETGDPVRHSVEHYDAMLSRIQDAIEELKTNPK